MTHCHGSRSHVAQYKWLVFKVQVPNMPRFDSARFKTANFKSARCKPAKVKSDGLPVGLLLVSADSKSTTNILLLLKRPDGLLEPIGTKCKRNTDPFSAAASACGERLGW